MDEREVIVNELWQMNPSDFAMEHYLYLDRVESIQLPEHFAMEEKKNGAYQFFYVQDGSGVLYYGEDVSCRLLVGSAVFMKCDQDTALLAGEDGLSIRRVTLNGIHMEKLYHMFGKTKSPVLFYMREREYYRFAVDRIQSAIGNENDYNELHIYSTLISLIALLLENRLSEHDTVLQTEYKETKDISLIRTYMDRYYQNKISLQNIADEFDMNKFYLERLFKKAYGKPIGVYLQEIRIMHVKRLLKFTNLTIEKIAFYCGYDDLTYMARHFKKLTAQTPSQYRKSIRQYF